MNILILGGIRLIGKHLVCDAHKVTIATRGLTPDNFGDDVILPDIQCIRQEKKFK